MSIKSLLGGWGEMFGNIGKSQDPQVKPANLAPLRPVQPMVQKPVEQPAPFKNAPSPMGEEAYDKENGFADGPVDYTYRHLFEKEGTGDNVTDVPTGKMGVTDMARKSVGAGADTPDEEVAKQYLTKLDAEWSDKEGYEDAPDEVKSMLLDATYNMGEQVLKFNGVAKALKDGDYDTVALNLLDTANVEGKTLKGLAKRRAESYNLAASNKIEEVEQLKDGTIIYRDENGDEIFSYRGKNGKHERSEPGRLKV